MKCWRAMQPDDLPAVAAISDAVHGRYTEPLAVYAERHALFPSGCFVFANAEHITGYLITHPWRHEAPPPLGALIGALPSDADRLYLHDLALLPEARGTGAGAQAAQRAIAVAAAEGFGRIVLVAVAGADRFWASQGFTPVADANLAAELCASYGPEVVYMRRTVG
ncbi:MAG: GNAT family N-acetyltransferase [Sphingomonas sp.]|nr:GNAT family N-acetyltransferase [Sphingomonas sp.]